EVPGGRTGPVTVAEDEHPRPQTDMAALTKLRPLFKDGVTTAGNASGINDGAVAMIVASREAGDAAGAKPIARILSSAVAGVEPRIMGFGPVPAAKKALARAGLSMKDMDVIETNEAFASQVLACLRGLEVPFDDSRVNPNGGAIAIGHPLGASGPRIALTAARQLQRTGGRYALVAMCVGVGQGIAAALEPLYAPIQTPPPQAGEGGSARQRLASGGDDRNRTASRPNLRSCNIDRRIGRGARRGLSAGAASRLFDRAGVRDACSLFHSAAR